MGMLSTLSIALYSEKQKKIWIVNVGDSRIYGFQNGKFIQLTKDDSKSQVVKVNGKMTNTDGLPLMKSYITKAIGQANLIIEVQEMFTDDYDAFILASDVFYSLFRFEDYSRKLIQEGDIKKTTSMLQEQLLSEITDDASFAILRLTNLKPIHLKEIIEKNNDDISVAMILSVFDKTLILAIETGDLEYQKVLLNFMEKKSTFYDKPKMIEILEIMIATKSPHVLKMTLMIRKL